MKLNKVAKTVVAAVGAAASALVLVAADGSLDLPDAAAILVAVLAAVGVYKVPNAPSDDK